MRPETSRHDKRHGRVSGQCVSLYFCALEAHPYAVQHLPMRKQTVGMCLRVLGAILWLPI